jgi:hypothetical protein
VAACHYPLNVTQAEIAASEKSPLSPAASGDSQPELLDDPNAPLKSGATVL